MRGEARGLGDQGNSYVEIRILVVLFGPHFFILNPLVYLLPMHSYIFGRIDADAYLIPFNSQYSNLNLIAYHQRFVCAPR